MPIYAQLNDGVVVGIIEAASAPRGDHVQLQGWDASVLGATWDGQAFTPAPPPPAPVIEVQRRQALRAIHSELGMTRADLLAAVDAAPGLTEAQREAMRIDIVDSNTFRRDNPTLLAMATALGLTPAQVDNLFAVAATIN